MFQLSAVGPDRTEVRRCLLAWKTYVVSLASLYSWSKLLMCLSFLALLVAYFPKIVSIVTIMYVIFSMLKWNMNFRPRFERSNSKCPSYYGCSIPAVEGKLPSVTIEDRYYGCFDHVYLTPLQWLWGQVFLAPNAFALMSVGVSRLWIRRHLQSRGLINPSVEYKKLLFRFIMNTSCAINIKFVDNTKMLARFVFTNLPVYRQDLGSFDIAD